MSLDKRNNKSLSVLSKNPKGVFKKQAHRNSKEVRRKCSVRVKGELQLNTMVRRNSGNQLVHIKAFRNCPCPQEFVS